MCVCLGSRTWPGEGETKTGMDLLQTGGLVDIAKTRDIDSAKGDRY